MESTAPPLVSADWLSARLSDPGLVVVDASWYLPAAGRDANAEYRTAHIPGAVRFDIDAIRDRNSDLPHMLPSAVEFAAAMEELGIGPNHHVVVYDGSRTNLSAARVWWTFRVFGHSRVSVLDGGFTAWASATRPVQHGEVRRPRTGYPMCRRIDTLVADRARVERIVAGAEQAQLVDARSAPRFNGEVDEPRPGLQRGHIPGSANLPFDVITNPETGILFPPEALREMFLASGLDPCGQIVASCGSGVSACSVALAIEVIRSGDAAHTGPPVAVYDGSWAEWGKAGKR
ncbi:MAG: 3-mercaptopyruvate sulfurtransferase [Gemmatimonadales bacterium]|nr:3-mercaptopyruvate sulfurtransferase [Gemmatimonadales bacterium]